MTPRRGNTLLELLITLAVMAIVASVVALAARPHQPPPPDALARVTEARREARAQRRPVTIEIVRDGAPYALTALPDGGVVADSALHFHRLTGARLDARR